MLGFSPKLSQSSSVICGTKGESNNTTPFPDSIRVSQLTFFLFKASYISFTNSITALTAVLKWNPFSRSSVTFFTVWCIFLLRDLSASGKHEGPTRGSGSRQVSQKEKAPDRK